MVKIPNYDEIMEKASQVPHYIEKWKNILGLQNWRIRYKFEVELSGGKHDAEVTWQIASRIATISYLMPKVVSEACQSDVKVWGDNLADYEAKTVHELMHIVFAQKYEAFQSVVDKLSPEASEIYTEQWGLAEEQTIEQLVQALLSFDRKGGDVS